jgi:hypothetical protein
MTIRLKPEVVVITLTNLHHEVGHDQVKAHIEGYFQSRTPLRDSISTTLNASSGRAGTFESDSQAIIRVSACAVKSTIGTIRA